MLAALAPGREEGQHHLQRASAASEPVAQKQASGSMEIQRAHTPLGPPEPAHAESSHLLELRCP